MANRSRWWYDSCEKKPETWGGGGWKICYIPTCLTFPTFFVWIAFGSHFSGQDSRKMSIDQMRSSSCTNLLGTEELQFKKSPATPLGYYFFCRLQDIQGLGTCFIWVADFFFLGGKTSQTLRESHASKLLLFCRTQRDGHQPSRTRREWPERAGRQLLTWAATFSSTGMRHVQQLGSPARCFFFFFSPPVQGV